MNVFILVVEGSHECSKARVERGLLRGLNVVAVFLQKLDCKHQIDIIDMAGTKAVLELDGTSEDAKAPLHKAGFNVTIWTGEIIAHRNSNIASTAAARRARGKSCELLEFITILYSFAARKSIL